MNNINLDDLAKRPCDFQVIERVPLTCEGIEFPLDLDCAAGDEIAIVVADCETTGLDYNVDALTELGLTRLLYSPSLGKVTKVVESKSWLQDPKQPISQFITDLTGLTDQHVVGKQITELDIAKCLEGNPIVISHFIEFDRPFIEKYVGAFPKNLRWACSAKDIDWKGAKIDSRKLEWILYKLGFFYDGHRADIDTKALSWVFIQRPDFLVQLMAKSKVLDVDG